MSNSFSGSGSLSGLGSFLSSVASAFSLLATKIIGYTNTLISGGSSYYTTTTGSVSTKYLTMGTQNGAMATSSDAINWTQAYLSGDWGNHTGVAGNGVYLFNNPNGKVHSTRNGTEWSVSRPFGSFYLDSLASSPFFDNNKFIIVKSASGGLTSYTSTNGTDWTEGPFSQSGLSSASFVSSKIIYANGIYAMLASTASSENYQQNTATIKVARSTDGLNWTGSTVNLDYGNINSCELRYLNGKFIFIHGTSGKTYYSTDAINFSLGTNLGESVDQNISIQMNNPSYPDGIAVSRTDAGQIVRSLDGVTWSKLSHQGSSVTTTGSVSVAGPIFLVSGSHYSSDISTVSYSYDGYNWSNLNINLPSEISAGGLASYADGKWLIPAYVGDVDGLSNILGFVYSSNLSNWTASLPVQGVYGEYGAQFSTNHDIVHPATFSTLVEIQVSIGNQGEEGAEILAPVDVYTVPAGMTAAISQVTIKNNSADTITYDLWILESGVVPSDLNYTQGDQPIAAGATTTVNVNGAYYQPAGTRIVVLPSAVDVVEVKVYGTES
jgi:hypothetical protein